MHHPAISLKRASSAAISKERKMFNAAGQICASDSALPRWPAARLLYILLTFLTRRQLFLGSFGFCSPCPLRLFRFHEEISVRAVVQAKYFQPRFCLN